MKTKEDKVFYSMIATTVIVVVFAFLFNLYFRYSNNYIYITLYSAIDNKKQVIKTSSGSNIDSELTPVNIDGYEFIGWFYDDELTVKVEQGTIFKSSRVLKAGYSKIVTKEDNQNIDYTKINNQKFVTIKTLPGISLTKNELSIILSTGVKYLDLEGCTLEENYIDNDLFNSQSSLRELLLPNNSIYIENNAFENCYNLSKIKLNRDLEKIESKVFYNCKNLELIENIEVVKSFGENVFEGCSKLKSINLGKNLNSISGKTFLGSFMDNMTLDSQNINYKIYGNVLYTSDYKTLIYAPSKYFGRLVVNVNTEIIDDYSLCGLEYLTELVLPSNISYIGHSSFKNCKNLSSIIFSNATNYNISNSAFEGCIKLKNLNFSIGLNSIGEDAFKNCEQLESVVFNTSTDSNVSNINSIGFGAFKNCNHLMTIVLPESVSFIDAEIFNGCNRLQTVSLSSKIKSIPEKMFYNNSSLETVITAEDLDSIGNYAFAECQSLKNINTLLNTKTLGHGTFKNCINLTDGLFKNVTVVGNECFYNCINLKNISFSNVNRIGEFAFYNCTELTSFTISDNVYEINSTAFENCLSIEYFQCNNNQNFVVEDGVIYNSSKECIITYPQNKKNIDFTILAEVVEIKDKGLFLNPNLKNIYVSSGNTYYSSEGGILYSYDKSILIRYPRGKENINVVISTEIETIGEYAFAYNDNIESLTLPNSLQTIANNAFYDMTAVSTLKIPFIGQTRKEDKFIGYLFGADNYISNYTYTPKTLKNIIITDDIYVAEYSFYDASNIEYIEYNKEVTTINRYAFYNARSLKEVYFNGSIFAIRENAFYELPSLQVLTIGFNSELRLESNSIGELYYSIDIYVHNKNKNVPQESRSELITKFSQVYSKARRWVWHFKNNA